MKLTCDLCGGDLQMNADGQSAYCVYCGLEYPKERLTEMLNSSTPVKPAEEPAKPRMHNLFVKRKFNLSACAAKAGVYLDGELCAVLSARGEACVPICEGTHEIVVRVASGIGIQEMEKVVFQVKDRDVYGLFYLRQSAFRSAWVFEVRESF